MEVSSLVSMMDTRSFVRIPEAAADVNTWGSRGSSRGSRRRSRRRRQS